MFENSSTSDEQLSDQTDRSWLGWTARILGALLVAFWFVNGILFNLNTPWTEESLIFAGLIVISASDVGLAWWRADIGGLALLTTALAHGVFAYIASDHNLGVTVAIRAGPFLVVALLFLAAWQYSGRRTGV